LLGGVGAECTAPGHDDIDVERDQLGRESGEPFGFPLSISIFDHEVADHGGCSPANPALLCLIYSAVSPHVLRLLCRYCALRAGSLTLTPCERNSCIVTALTKWVHRITEKPVDRRLLLEGA